MVKVNNENIVSSLFVIGFDRVSPDLFSFVLGKIVLGDNGFVYSDEDYCGFFKSVVIVDEEGFRFKNGYTLDTNISLYPNQIWKIRDTLNIKNELVEFLNSLNYEEYLFAKLYHYQSNLKQFNSKEREMLADMFGYDDSMSKYSYKESVEKFCSSKEKVELADDETKEEKHFASGWYKPRFEVDENGLIRERKK